MPRRAAGRKPLIIAHRGARSAAPENSMSAFSKAFALGADGIEFDVDLALDGAPVIIHQESVVPNGRGILEPAGPRSSRNWLAKTSSKRAAALDCGLWFGRGFKGERVPLLSRLTNAARKGQSFFAELKDASYWSTRPKRDFPRHLAAAALPHLKDAMQRGADVRVLSFNPAALLAMRRIAPRLPRYLVCQRMSVAKVSKMMKGAGVRGVVLPLQFLAASEEWLEWCASADLEIFVYESRRPHITEKDGKRGPPAALRKAWQAVRELPLTGIITDFPKHCRRYFHGARSR